MSTLLLKNAQLLITMDPQRRQIRTAGVLRDSIIEQVGPSAELPASADRVIDTRGMTVLPGMVNTHHHLYQTLTRCMAQDDGLFNWLRSTTRSGRAYAGGSLCVGRSGPG